MAHKQYPKTVIAVLGLSLAIGGVVLYNSARNDRAANGQDSPIIAVQSAMSAQADPSAEASFAHTTPPDPADGLGRKLGLEPRDAVWAGASENVLTDQLHSVPMLTAATGLTLRCATSVCQVRGFVPAGLDTPGRAIYWRMVQGPAVRQHMAERGLTLADAKLGASGQFELYYTRIERPLTPQS